MRSYNIGSYVCNAGRNYCNLAPSRGCSDPNNSVKNFDHIMRQSLNKLFRRQCGSSSDQIKNFLRGLQRNTKRNSIIKQQILKLEPVLSRQFSKEELGKLSLLWISVLGSYYHSAELLVCSGADVNELFGRHKPQVIDKKWTVLHVLLQMRPSPENERLVQLVVDHGADLQARDTFGRTALRFAVLKGRVQTAEMLLEKGADLHSRDSSGRNVMHSAAISDQPQINAMLLEKGAKVNVADDNGITPLLIAADSSKADELLPLLMKHGADVTAKSKSGSNILHELTLADDLKCAAELVGVFIEKGVSLDDRSSGINQLQPIHKAAMSSNNDLVNLYLDHGANVNSLAYIMDLDTQEDIEMTALYAATQGRFSENTLAVLKTLLKRGADINRRTSEGRTALHSVCEMFGYDEELDEQIIRLLLSAGADVLIEDRNGITPLALIEQDNIGKSGTRLIVKNLALIKARKPMIELKDESIIEQHLNLRNYYRDCIEQIERLKSTRFIESCTFFELITKCHCQIAALMQNPKFESNFRNYDKSEFSMYAEDVQPFERAQKHYHFMLEQEDVINEAVYHILPHVVVRNVVHYICNCCKSVK